MECEEDEEDKDTGKTQLSDEDKAAKPDSTEGVSKTADPITLNELLQQARVSTGERETFKNNLSLWFPK